jgi:hypothetical protein
MSIMLLTYGITKQFDMLQHERIKQQIVHSTKLFNHMEKTL